METPTTISACLDALAAMSRLERRIHKLFGFAEQWRYLPIEDQRNVHWASDTHAINFCLTADEKPDEQGMNWTDCTVYRGITHNAEGLTMIAVDAHSDGNMSLCVFDDDKRLSMDSFAGPQ